jgi:5-methylcytosine-specific restriction endonuclease McrA
MAHTCSVCGVRAYSAYCVRHKPKKAVQRLKRPRSMGKQGTKWVEFRDTVARPYLDSVYGHTCSMCGVGGRLDVDHIKKRGSHPELRYELSNLRYLCRSCHIKET